MYSSMDKIKEELKELCNEYIHILEQLKDDEIITEETYDICSSSKVSFLEE
ncbi:hypothetical protein [Romboutsia lituseburensis]|uniref:hypothetical protein n=1 Tax=Romboutsia lituseburensis TaxID=1537 RepID=UPI00215ABAF5|nr:hypothetical protein [Romboutsia lituseburensis]MCR8745932.1 hypothetical protein [Romboutsia lituseburensis]